MSGLASKANDQLDLFRAILAISIILKAWGDHHYGMWRYFGGETKSVTQYRYERSTGPVVVLLSPSAYRAFYITRAVCAVFLLFGILPQLSAAVLAAWFLFEFTWNRRNNTLFFAILCIPLCFTSDLAHYFSLDSAFHSATMFVFLVGAHPKEYASWPQVVLVVFITEVYWSSAYHKIRSKQFMSGDALQKTFEQSAALKDLLPPGHREYFFPDWFTRRLALGRPELVARRWRPAAWTAVFFEIVLPLLLLNSTTWPVAAVLGILLHTAFTGIQPKRLAPFSVAIIGSYILFLPPRAFSHFQESMSLWVT